MRGVYHKYSAVLLDPLKGVSLLGHWEVTQAWDSKNCSKNWNREAVPVEAGALGEMVAKMSQGIRGLSEHLVWYRCGSLFHYQSFCSWQSGQHGRAELLIREPRHPYPSIFIYWTRTRRVTATGTMILNIFKCVSV